MSSFWSIFIFSSVMYLQYTLSSKINLSSKIIHNLRQFIFLIFLGEEAI